MKPHDTYKDWVQLERNGFWKNTLTGESTIWHPQVIEIAAPAYQRAREWCSEATTARNKRTKNQSQ